MPKLQNKPSLTNVASQCLDIAGSRSTQHLVTRVFLIIIVVWTATYLATPSNIYQLYSIVQSPNKVNTLGVSELSWYRAMLVTCITIMAIIIALSMKGGRMYQDDLIFISILAIYCLYWWKQWYIMNESFTNGCGIGGGSSMDASILATGLSGEDWDNIAIGRTWTRDLSSPKDRTTQLVAGVNRPEHYDFAPDDMPLYQLEPDLADMRPSIEMEQSDLNEEANTSGAGEGVRRRFAALDGPLPDGRSHWHTKHTEHQIATVLNKNSRGFGGRSINGVPSDFNKNGWGTGRENMSDNLYTPAGDLGTNGLTPTLHKNWLRDHGYKYFGEGGDEACRNDPRIGCGLDGMGRGECRNSHYCSNISAPTDDHIKKVTRGGKEMLGYP